MKVLVWWPVYFLLLWLSLSQNFLWLTLVMIYILYYIIWTKGQYVRKSVCLIDNFSLVCHHADVKKIIMNHCLYSGLFYRTSFKRAIQNPHLVYDSDKMCIMIRYCLANASKTVLLSSVARRWKILDFLRICLICIEMTFSFDANHICLLITHTDIKLAVVKN